MIRYFNFKSVYGIETIDEISQKNFNSYKEFKTELRRLLKEYYLCGINVYVSQRSTREWREIK